MALNGDGMKQSLVNHGEKIAFFMIVLVAAFFTWKATTRERLPAAREAGVLTKKASDATSHVNNSTFNANEQQLQVVDYRNRLDRSTLDIKDWDLEHEFNPPTGGQKTPRGTPTIYPPTNLRVSADFGSFAMKQGGKQGNNNNNNNDKGKGGNDPRAQGGGGGSRGKFKASKDSALEAKTFVSILAVVPMQEQEKEYARVFQRALDYQPKTRDFVDYTGFELRRADVTNGMENLKWVTVPYRGNRGMQVWIDRWEGHVPDRVDDYFKKKYFEEDAFTLPLAPLTSSSAMGMNMIHPLVMDDWNNNSKAERDALSKQQKADTEAKRREQEAKFEGKKGKNKNKDEQAEDSAADEPAAEAAPAQTEKKPSPQQAKGKNAPKRPPSTYRMVRVYDFTAEYNKKYVYQVQVITKNPNYEVKKHMLANPDEEQEYMLRSEWSEPSPVVSIPDPHRVFVRSIAKAGTKTEPAVKLTVTSISASQGIEAGADVDVFRSGLANAPVTTGYGADPREGFRPTKDTPDLNLISNNVLLDVRGGKSIGRRANTIVTPVESLLVDPRGNLIVRNEMMDAYALQDHLSVDPFPALRPPQQQNNAKGNDKGKGDPKGGNGKNQQNTKGGQNNNNKNNNNAKGKNNNDKNNNNKNNKNNDKGGRNNQQNNGNFDPSQMQGGFGGNGFQGGGMDPNFQGGGFQMQPGMQGMQGMPGGGFQMQPGMQGMQGGGFPMQPGMQGGGFPMQPGMQGGNFPMQPGMDPSQFQPGQNNGGNGGNNGGNNGRNRDR